MLKNKNVIALAGVIALGVISSGAFAQVVQTQNGVAIPGIGTTVTFNAFNGALGTLTDVILSITEHLSGTLHVNNGGTVPENWINVFGQASATVHGTGAQAALTTTSTVSHTDTATVLNEILTPGQTLTLPAFSGVTSTSTIDLVSGIGVFVNPPANQNVVLDATGTHFISGSGDNDINYGGSTSPTVDVTLTYFYTSSSTTTPEPGAYALVLASASVSIVGLRRRRSLKK